MRVAALTVYEGSKLTSLPEGFVQHLMKTFERMLRAPKNEIAMISLAAPCHRQRWSFRRSCERTANRGIDGPEITAPVRLAMLEHRREMIDAFFRDAIANEKSRYEGLGPGAHQRKYNELIVAARFYICAWWRERS